MPLTDSGNPYTIVSSQPTVVLAAPGITQDVIEEGVREDTYGVQFTIRIPAIVYRNAGSAGLTGIYVDQIVEIMGYAGVVDAAYFENVRQNSVIYPYLDIYVSPDDGLNVGVFAQPFGALDFARVQPLIDWMYRVVQANIEGTTPPARPAAVGTVGGGGFVTGGGV
jgi:hypothetical protein